MSAAAPAPAAAPASLHTFEPAHLAAVKTLNSVLFPVKYHVRGPGGHLGTLCGPRLGVH
jgi:hypothetical protein